MITTAEQFLQLTLLRHGELIQIDIGSPGALIPRSETRVDDAFLSELARALEAAGGGDRNRAALARVGSLISSHLLSEHARRRLRDAQARDLHLRLDERLVHVPWELCHDGEQFLFERFRIARQVITAHPLADRPPPRSDSDQLRILVIADPTDDLPQAAVEGERLCALLDELPGLDVTLLAGASARRVPVLAALQEHQIAHFAGHSDFDAAAPQRSGWRLADGTLTAQELGQLRAVPALLFSNSCAAAATAPWRGSAGYDGSSYGLGSAFLLNGAQAYIGTFWAVHDQESLTCASGFYGALAAGADLGEALARARQAVRATHGDSFTWASYLLYGDPALRPFAQPQPAPARRSGDSVPGAREEVRYRVAIRNDDAAPVVDRVGEIRHFVGRDAEVDQLLTSFAQVVESCERNTVLISGSPGIGKSTLLDRFLARLAADPQAWIAYGQAVEHYGAGEAYLPLLEALGRLGASPARPALIEQLHRHAPTWLAQLPALTEAHEREALARRALGSSRERMLRELADVLDALTVDRPLVLVIEDLHWSDHSTIEAIHYLAQRRAPARLLLVGTFRPAEVLASEHPLRAVSQELEARRRSTTLPLAQLGAREVERYLQMRLSVATVAPELVTLVFRRTEGHPLFLVNVVDFALRQGLVAVNGERAELSDDHEALAASIPQGLLPMIERQIESLPDADQRLLEAAAAAGAEFSAASVAAALDISIDATEDRCEALAWRGHMLRSVGMEEWPDGTIAGQYRFLHALYQNVLHQRIAAPRRIRLHKRIAEAKARSYGEQANVIAAQLASHFEEAHEPQRALVHRICAGDLAVVRHAEQEAVEHYRRALGLLPRVGGRADSQRELELLVKLATRLLTTAGYASAEVEQIFERAYALSRQLPHGPYRAPLLRTLVSFHHVRGRLADARAVGVELLELCERGEEDRTALVQALYGLGTTLYDLGELEVARAMLERSLALYEESSHPLHVATYGGYDPGVACNAWLAWLHWLRGEPDQALLQARRAYALAEQLGHPFSQAFSGIALALVLLQRRDLEAVSEPIERARGMADESGFPFLRAVGAGVAGWLRLLQGDPAGAIALCEEALAAQRATGSNLNVPAYLMVLAYSRLFSGDGAGALATVEAGLEDAQLSGQRVHLVTLWRVRGEILAIMRGPSDTAAAEDSLRQASSLAREVGALMLELQTATSLARALTAWDRTAEARALLEPVYARFTEGFASGPLLDARALLES